MLLGNMNYAALLLVTELSVTANGGVLLLGIIVINSVINYAFTCNRNPLFKYEIYCTWLQKSRIIVKLTYFGAEFETESDILISLFVQYLGQPQVTTNA